MEPTSICILPGKPEIAFKELHTEWMPNSGSWKVVAKVESLDSLPKFKVRTVKIWRRNGETHNFYESELNPKLNIPKQVMEVYENFRKMVKEF
ncbi:hypothetical protein [Sporosarcina sp. A2]|uniref:hypothetical protein n=1 Tax=Sporosarcina sp. A2 TaxID=3393449 RepID=UPI003D7A97F9